MSFSHAAQFEQHVNNQLSKPLGAIPVLVPILRRLGVAEIINGHRPGDQEVSHGTNAEVLILNRLMAPKPLYKVKEWMAETMLEDALDVGKAQMHDMNRAHIGRSVPSSGYHLAGYCRPGGLGVRHRPAVHPLQQHIRLV